MRSKGTVIHIDAELEKLLNKETIKRTTPDKILSVGKVARDILWAYFNSKKS